MQKNQAKKTKRVRMVPIFIALACVLTFYVIYHLVKGFTPALNTATATGATETVVRNYEAYIMRNETVLTSGNSGYCDYLIGDGDYSKTDAELARVYTSDREDVALRIAEIDERLAILQECARQAVIKTERQKMIEGYNSILTSLRDGNISDARTNASTLLESMYTLEINTGLSSDIAKSIADAESEIESLTAEREALCRSLGVYSSVISAGTGCFFHGTDGYEDIFSSREIADITLAGFKEMLQKEPKRADGAIGTYVSDYTWYLAIPTSMSETVNFTEGSVYTVNFKYTSGITLDMELYRIVRDGNETDAVMVFSSSTLPDGFDRTRIQSVEIEVASYTGNRIAAEALTENNGNIGVWILSDGKISWRNVDVLYKNELYVIALDPSDMTEDEKTENSLSLNDTYVLSGKGLYEGKLIN